MLCDNIGTNRRLERDRDRIYTSESDVCRRQIQTYKDGPRSEKNEIFLIAADPLQRYSNETERAN